MKYIIKAVSFTILFTIIIVNNVLAVQELQTSKIFLDFSAKDTQEYFILNNNGDSEARVEILVTPLEEDSEKIKSNTKHLVSMPRYFTLKQNESKKVRITRIIKPSDEDLFFLVRILNHTAIKENKREDLLEICPITPQRNFCEHTEILSIIRPKHLRPSLDIKRDQKILFLENTGNTTISLAIVEQCNEKCINYGGTNIYPHEKKIIKVKDDKAPVKIVQNVQGNTKTIVR